MSKLHLVGELLRQWRRASERDGRQASFTGTLLILLSLVVRWPKEPPRIEPFIYAHF